MFSSLGNPVRKKVVDWDDIEVGSDPKCKIMPIQICIEARGCKEDGCGSGKAHLVVNTGASQIEWHDGWSRDEAIYHAIGRAIADVPVAGSIALAARSPHTQGL